MGDGLVAASFAPQLGRYRSIAQCVHTVFDQGALPSIMALLI
jgi:hypothetical protein